MVLDCEAPEQGHILVIILLPTPPAPRRLPRGLRAHEDPHGGWRRETEQSWPEKQPHASMGTQRQAWDTGAEPDNEGP